MITECSTGNIPPGYKQTEVGVIPEDWNIEPLGSLADVTMGQSPVGSSYNKSGIGLPLINGPTEFTKKYPVKVQWTSEPTKTCRKDDLLLCVRGSSTGRTNVSNDEYCIGRGIAAIRAKPSSNTAYLTYQIHLGIEELLTLSAGSTFPNVDGKSIRSIQIPIPPTKAEQETIAEALSDADAFIESLEQLIAKKRQIKQGAMQELLTGKRRMPGFSGEWETKLLGEVIAGCSSGATPYRGRSDYYKGNVKWITSGELNYNLITDTLEHISNEAVENTNLKMHPIGIFLMAITGLEAAGTRGACGIVGSPSTTNQSCMAIYPTSELKTEYLYHYYVFRGNELALQYCQGTKQQSYTAKLVKLLPIDLPPSIEEQEAIASILSDMDSEITVLEEKLAKARQIKQGMMQELLTGKIRLI